MRRIAVFTLLALVAIPLLAHRSHVHHFLGTVKSVDAGHLLITTQESKQVEFLLTDSTRYTRNGDPASKGDLRPGLRVSVHVADDGKTATSVMLPAK
ncbi:MAG: hypothetical protein ACXW3E_01995 [Thermoanaerobaculia bacterium]